MFYQLVSYSEIQEKIINIFMKAGYICLTEYTYNLTIEVYMTFYW